MIDPCHRSTDLSGEPVAVTGMSCRFPKAPHLQAFWQLLERGDDAISEVPADRFNVNDFYDPDPEAPGKMYVRHGGFIDHVFDFDPGFFGIAPREAISMDPQQRLLLEVSWEALEDAGEATDRLNGRNAGVFVGHSTNDYVRRSLGREIDAYSGTGSATSIAAGRISYIFGLTGPNLPVDTACSSSLVALHLACQSLRNGECELALAAGVNLILAPEPTVYFCKMHALSPDGRCKTFDALANGYVRGEGCGAIVLKRLSQALADDDRIYAVIRGSAVNQDGKSSGLTVPNRFAQERLLRRALATSGVAPQDIDYIEAHGTGTPLGDPIEIRAIAAVHEGRPTPLYVGSVKTNVGHLEAAAGIAGVIKTVLAIHRARIPPHLNFHQPNPYIPWTDFPGTIPTSLTAWPDTASKPRMAGVSSFGFSGTNAHVVIEQAPQRESRKANGDRPLHILCLSAKSESALREVAERTSVRLASAAAESLPDLCYSANSGRSHFTDRLAVIAANEAEAQTALTEFCQGVTNRALRTANVNTSSKPKVAFLFTGQGSQYVHMGRELYASLPAFRRTLDECDELLRQQCELSLLDILYPDDGASSAIDQTAYSQPALFALEYSLARVWQSWGVEPASCLGHSIGELVAACVAGVFSLKDGLWLAAERGRLMQSLPAGGAMASVHAARDVVDSILTAADRRVSIAALNGPTSTVISGGTEAIEAVLDELSRRGIAGRRLTVSHAFHSSLMDPVLDRLEELAERIDYSPPRIGLVSNVTGQMARGEDLVTAKYWRRHAREPVLFADGVRTLDDRGYGIYLEIGPQPVLTTLVRSCLSARDQLSVPTLRRDGSAWRQMLHVLGELYLCGIPVDWRGFDDGFHRHRVSVPTYPFERSRYALEAGDSVPTPAVVAQPTVSLVEGNAEDETYAVEWVANRQQVASEQPPAGQWLLFIDGAGVGARLAQSLESKGSSCVLVEPGNECQALAANRWRVRPGSPDDFKQLLSAIEPGHPCVGVVHLWSLNAADADQLDGNALSDAALLGTASSLHVIQALAVQRALDPPPVWLVTRGVQRIRDEDTAAGIAQAPLWGMARALAIEYPNLRCTRVDVDSSAHLEQCVADSTARLLSLLCCSDGEDQVAFRGGQRYVPRLHSAGVRDQYLTLDASGTYLITGGLGGLGVLVAHWMIDNGARQLALVGRRAPDEHAQEAIARFQQMGVAVSVLQADVADVRQVSELFERLATTMPTLKGIVHAAGILDDGSFVTQDWSRFEKVMGPKVSGAWNLHTQTLGMPLDFMVFFSTIGSLLGAPTQSNYCAANAFMDALAHHRRASGRPALSINWGPWKDAGMAARQQPAALRAWEMLGIATLPPHDALQSFGGVLGSAAAQLGILKADWSKLVSLFPPGLEPRFLRDLVQGKRRLRPAAGEWSALVTRVRSTSAEGARREVRAFVEKLAAEILGRPANTAFDPESGFFAMGMDSLMALEFTARLRANLGDAHLLPVSFLFNHPTIQSVTDYLVKEVLALRPVAAAAPTPLAPQSADAVAIIGYACRFPGARDEGAYWDLLCEGRDAIREVPADRWDVNRYYDRDPKAPGKMFVREGGFLEDVDRFDAQFFGISPREAIKMDPQHRLLLETAWRALENAHQPPDRLKGTKTGVFVGISGNDYIRTIGESMDWGEVDAYFAPGNALSIAAGRLSYMFGFEGPCLALDTACSSSLAAVHIACNAVRTGKARLALAGGVNLVLAPEINISLCKIGALAPDGRCKTFDASANGYVRSEGCGIVVLKRLDDARADGDRILAVVRSSAMNHDGRSSGLTVPNGAAQEALFREVLAESGVGAGEIQYVEAHGTGTPLGDPIEMQSIASVYGGGARADGPLIVGSVKTNIGHLEAAAGIAGLIKVVQSMEHGKVPPHIHFRQPSPYVDWPRIGVKIPTRLEEWPAGDRRLAAVSSFGFSGTNVHCIVEGPVADGAVRAETPERPLHLLCLSAKSEPALLEHARSVSASLKNHTDSDLPDVCYSLNAGRTHFSQRVAVLGRTVSEAAARLEALSNGARRAESMRLGPVSPPGIAFLFTGHGSQYAGMGRQLFETQPTFRRAIEEGAAVLDGVLDKTLVAALYPPKGRRSLVNHPLYAQPALFLLEYALVRLWESWGIRPSMVAGHSLGECAAACTAGVFSLESALKLVTERARLMQKVPRGGGMLAVAADVATVTDVLRPYSDLMGVAAINSPHDTVVSGLLQPLDRLSSEFELRGIRTRKLNVPYAFHSSLLDLVGDDFMRVARSVDYATPKLPIVSAVTGGFMSHALATPEYWARQLLMPVKFTDSMRTLAATDCSIFLEIGPHPTLTTLAQQTLGSGDGDRVWLYSLRRRASDWQEMLRTLGQLYLHGADCDWKGFDRDYDRRWVPVANYPFQRERFWPRSSPSPRLETPLARLDRRADELDHGDLLLGRRLRSPALQDIVFENRFSAEHPAFLADHKIFSMVVVPGASHLAMALAAASHVGFEGRVELTDVTFPEGMILGQGESRLIQLLLSPLEDAAHDFRVVSAREEEAQSWLIHCTGRLVRKGGGGPALSSGDALEDGAVKRESIATIQHRCADHLPNTDMFYRLLAQHGIELGANFQWVQEIWRRPGEALGRLRPAQPVDGVAAFRMHPGWIDACFQLLTVTLTKSTADFATHLPISVGRFVLYARPESSAWIHVTLRPKQEEDDGSFESDIEILSESGSVVAAIDRFRVRRAPKETLSRFAQRDITDALYSLQWTRRDARVQPTPQVNGSWLVFDRSEARGHELIRMIENAGGHCLRVEPGVRFEKRDDGTYSVDPTSADSVRDLLNEVVGRGPEPIGVIHAWSCAESLTTPLGTPSAIMDEQLYGAHSVLTVVQALASVRRPRSPRLWVATAGVQPVPGRQTPVDVTHSPLWGLGRVVALEHPHLRCTRIDLDPAAAVNAQAHVLFSELTADDREDQVAYCGEERFVARLSRYRVSPNASGEELQLPRKTPFRLVRGVQGALSEISIEISSRQAPGRGEVEIRTVASALNFRDVLNALGLYPGGTGAMGWEAAGVVTAIGADVSHVNVGDEVIALAPGSFSKFVITDARLTVAKPTHIGFASAAGIPVVFLTAHYALRELARVRRGDRVLIHAAAGGVGLAAVQLARGVGAEVFATAGSAAKRDYLKGLGIGHVFDSRSLDFADEIRSATLGAGVDVVLNALPGEYIAKNLSLLAEGGRFVEIGKLGTWTPAQVAAVRPDVQYFHFALDTLVFEQTDDVAEKLSSLVKQFASGELEPLPHAAFPLRVAKDAFRHMAQARHIGKVILDHDDGSKAADATSVTLRDDATYLVTGGLGGLGVGLTQWLVDQGVRYVVLVGRHEPTTRVAEVLSTLESRGARIVPLLADVSNEDDLRGVLARIRGDLPPLRGVFHAAGVLADGILVNQEWNRFKTVMAAKVLGTIHLDRLTEHDDLDLFVMFSSAASLLGFPGQGNYSAANSFLDAFAHHRQAQGKPGQSINWGAWDDVGMTAGLKRQWSILGLNTIKNDQGFETLGVLLRETCPQVAVLPIEWSQVAQRFPHGEPPPIFAGLAREFTGSLEPTAEWIELRKRVAEAPPAERKALVLQRLLEMGRGVLGLGSNRFVDPTVPLNELGFDSLMAVELAKALGRAAGTSMPVTLLFDYPTFDALAGYLLNEVLHPSPRPRAPGATVEGQRRSGVVSTAQTDG